MKHFKPKKHLPHEWDKLSTPQMEQLAKLLLRYTTLDDVLVRMVAYIHGFRLARPAYSFRKKDRKGSYIIAKGLRRAYILPIDMAFMTFDLGFIFHENEIFPRRIVNPYPSIRVGLFRNKRLLGAGKALTDLIVDEWIEVELARAEFNKTNETKHLARMMAVMWRPAVAKTDSSDKREPLQSGSIEQRSRLILRWLNPARARVFLWWYQGCLLFLAYRFPYVFKMDPELPEEADTSATDPSAERSANRKIDHFSLFMDMVNSMAKDDPTKIKTVRRMPLWEALHNMNKIVKQQKENSSNE